MLLSDGTIKNLVESGTIGITPYEENRVQPASYDVSLEGTLRFFEYNRLTHIRVPPIDPMDSSTFKYSEPVDTSDGRNHVLYPGEFCLYDTKEKITLPDYIAARIEGKSSLARLGLAIHVTAGFIDPGFSGTITLELYNCSNRGIVIRPGMKIAQLCFFMLDKPSEKPYGHPERDSKYMEQSGPTGSEYHKNYDDQNAEEVPKFRFQVNQVVRYIGPNVHNKKWLNMHNNDDSNRCIIDAVKRAFGANWYHIKDSNFEVAEQDLVPA